MPYPALSQALYPDLKSGPKQVAAASTKRFPTTVVPGDHPGLIEPGNIDIEDRPMVPTGDGGYATVYSMGISDREGGPEILIPTVIPHPKGGYYIAPPQEAVAHYRKTGEHLGKFATTEDSDRYAELLHQQQASLLQPIVHKPPVARYPDLVVAISKGKK